MRIIIAAIGKSRSGPERSLYEEYIGRLPWRVTLRELEVKQDLSAPVRKTRETALLLEACQGVERIVAMDEKGEQLSSREFGLKLDGWRVNGASSMAFIIGGADGLDAAQLKNIHLKFAFGRASWPHMLARAMLAEQLYRAHTLMTGHPYHRD